MDFTSYEPFNLDGKSYLKTNPDPKRIKNLFE